VTIVGAGIVGVVTAHYLLAAGFRVTVVDRGEPGGGCSFGNAGLISAGGVVPYAVPGALWNVPRWLLDPNGPLKLQWRTLPRSLPFLVGWARSSTAERAEKIAEGMATLHRPCLDLYAPLVEDAAAGDLIRRKGLLYASARAEAIRPSGIAKTLRQRFGIASEEFHGAALRDLEPALPAQFTSALYLPGNAHCLDSFAFVQRVAAAAERRGALFLRREVRDVEFSPDGPRRLVLDDGSLELDQLVIAAGAWSERLARRLGSKVPLQAERGYHVTIPHPNAPTPEIPFISRDHGFASTPMATGFRLAGTAELADVDARPDWRRTDALLKHGRALFPDFDMGDATRWMGPRPSMPDGLPVLGPAPGVARTWFAFGNGHFGLTAAPVMGRTIAELIAGQAPQIDIAPYAATRF
jgi:D-amino-acid dehydrogenase